MKSEFGRGVEESPQQMTALRERWPLAFPVKPHDVRPLALGCAGEIAAAMGWSLPYAKGVLVFRMASSEPRPRSASASRKFPTRR